MKPDKPTTAASVVKRLAFLIALALGGGAAIVGSTIFLASVSGPSADSDRSASPDAQGRTESQPAVSDLSFAAFDSKFSTMARATDEQKKRLIEQYKGTRVRWQGIVQNVDGNMVFLKLKATTLSYDVALRMADAERAGAASISKGILITYEGTIRDYGAILAHDLRDGRITDQRTLSPDEQATWLAESETAALKPIADEADRH